MNKKDKEKLYDEFNIAREFEQYHTENIYHAQMNHEPVAPLDVIRRDYYAQKRANIGKFVSGLPYNPNAK